MSRVGRATLWFTAGLLGVFVLGIVLLLRSLDSQLSPECLDAVAQAPADAYFVENVISDDATLRVLYDDGTEAVVPLGPQRIVSSLPGITEMICYLGAEERLVAVSPHCDHPASVQALPRIKVQPFDAEAIIAAKPDLVVVDRRLHRRDLDRIRLRCPAVLMLETSRSLQHLTNSMHLLASVIGTASAQDHVSLRFEMEREALLDRLRQHMPSVPPRVLVITQWEPLYVCGKGSLLDDLLRLCGCINVACDLEGDASGTFPEELVLARRPDWILTPDKPMPERLRERWRNIPAVKHGRLTDGSADDLVRAGPRILAGLERLAGVLQADAGSER